MRRRRSGCLRFLPAAKDAEHKLPADALQGPFRGLLEEGGSALPKGESVLPKAEDAKPEGEEEKPEGEP